MNRFYIIIPAILLTLFSFAYWQHSKEAHEVEVKRVAAEKAAKEEEARKKEEDIRRAKEDNLRREEERKKEDAAKEKKRKDEYEKAMAKIREDRDSYAGKAAESQRLAQKIEKDLATLRANKEKLNREVLDAAKKVELARIEKRNAEMEIQRFTEMLAKRAADSAMAKPPMVTAAAPAK